MMEGNSGTIDCFEQRTEPRRVRPTEPDKPGLMTEAAAWMAMAALIMAAAGVYVLGAIELGGIITQRLGG